MPNESGIVADPFHNKVYISEGTCSPTGEPSTDNEVLLVISKPAIMVEVHQDHSRLLYYFRSVDWHHTLLISVHFNNGRWETFHCEKNPTNETLSHLLKKGRQLI